ncbi:MAG: OmpA family protein [Flavobacteriaceae bacterium]
MKHLKSILFVLLIVVAVGNLQAQDENNPWSFDFGTNAVDFFPTNHPSIISANGDSAGLFDEFGNQRDHYNFLPSPVSRFHVGKYISNGISAGAAVSFNNIDQVGEMSQSDESYIGIDMDLRYDLNNLIGETKWFDPYVTIGGGYTIIDEDGNGTLNGGLGTNLWFTDNVGLNLQSNYKHSFDDARQLPHFQHALGLILRFGGTDTDNDGIYDDADACPDVKGVKAFNGCPDTDGDGIKDSEDACPSTAGTVAMNGCPDSDNDGIADNKDACPTVKGNKANNGCPDSDNDGVIDSKDKCPTVKGPKANKGCPFKDSDKDGILDKDDKCPKEKGVKKHNGCPPPPVVVEAPVVVAAPVEVISTQAQAQLDTFARSINFNSARATFKSGVKTQLDRIYEIMTQYPNANFSIDGHTDSQGSNSLNKSLSEKRAAAVKAYLVGKGLSDYRLSSYGFGEDYPIDTNSTSAGRANNRRVEIRLIK